MKVWGRDKIRLRFTDTVVVGYGDVIKVKGLF